MRHLPTPRARENLKFRETNFWSNNVSSGWTPERRTRQGVAIHRWKPWERSTGPRTTEGKAIAVRNAYRGATRPLLRELARALRQQNQLLKASSRDEP